MQRPVRPVLPRLPSLPPLVFFASAWPGSDSSDAGKHHPSDADTDPALATAVVSSIRCGSDAGLVAGSYANKNPRARAISGCRSARGFTPHSRFDDILGNPPASLIYVTALAAVKDRRHMDMPRRVRDRWRVQF